LEGFPPSQDENSSIDRPIPRHVQQIISGEASKGETADQEQSEIATSSDPLKMHRWTTAVFGIAPEAFCPPEVRGYCLTTKKWVSLNVDGVSHIEWNDTAYDRLVIAPPRKRLLRALVEEHKHQKAQTDDMIRGKGQGLILLLNGPPGTGKTLTADAIADKLHLPFYTIDASQLGDDIEKLEENLRTIFRIAGTWDVVVLLDEADAFLERRSSNPEHAERKKRVAIFLRVLEYFRGILILTSNRAVEFDDAFHSRIHLTLQYPDLDHLARVEVWTNILDMARHALTVQDINEFAKEDMNGRQIKNVIKMSRLLAKSEDHTLNAANIRDVIAIMKDDMLPTPQL
jgi:SpoVK/Ycf46/Vps4 family AAA+-type ATPase